MLNRERESQKVAKRGVKETEKKDGKKRFPQKVNGKKAKELIT